MDKSTSLYLDVCRFSAALIVFFHHYFYPPFYLGDLRVTLGRKAVVIFFVISGFVIAFVTHHKEAIAQDYFINRAARLYSVVLPALALTLVLDYLVRFLEPSLFDSEMHTQPAVRLLFSILFLNQSWNFTVAALSNGPFWSLCYEFWYYVIFGLFIYTPKKFRYWATAVALLLAGPRILLLFPIWLMGVAAYRWQHRLKGKLLVPAVFCISSVTFLVLLLQEASPLLPLVSIVKSNLKDGYLPLSPTMKIFLGGDANFPADYALGIAFALSVMTSQVCKLHLRMPRQLQRMIRFLSSYTFSLYLFHVPLLLFFASCFSQLTAEPARGIILIAATFSAVLALGTLTEQRKYVYSQFFSRIVRRPIDTNNASEPVIIRSL